ncbi:muts domain V-domain-containing protein [Lipomyces arxii]|uniref:muts domain V-domain-containing protein n=1 Tax=Lipomyces arxii TaxID=56418 RepID=UPI0034CED548
MSFGVRILNRNFIGQCLLSIERSLICLQLPFSYNYLSIQKSLSSHELYKSYEQPQIVRRSYATKIAPKSKTKTGKETTKKRKLKVTLKEEELAQGLIVSADLDEDLDADRLGQISDYEAVQRSYPTVLQEAKDNMDRLPNCVLLTRVGSFYELYFHQADEYGPLLNLRVATRRTLLGPVSMAGFPFMYLDRYLKILVQDLHKYVAISDEFPNPHAKKENQRSAAAASRNVQEADFPELTESDKKSGNQFIRKVCRIVTPGTLIDEKFLDSTQNNYLLAVSLRPLSAPELQSDGTEDAETERFGIGLAWLDFSTGDFLTQESSSATLQNDLARISPSEILLNKDDTSDHAQHIHKVIQEQQYFVTYGNFAPLGSTATNTLDPEDPDVGFKRQEFISKWHSMFEDEDMKTADVSKLEYDELSACSALLDYVTEKLPGTTIKLQAPVRRLPVDNMSIDSNSLRALEIKKTIRDQLTSGSLLSTIKRTVTKSGTRLLSDWLSSPITSIPLIAQRQNLVEMLLNDNHLHQMVVLYLKRTHDSHRAVQKLALGRGDAEDMIALLQSIQSTAKLRTMFENYLETTAEENSVARQSLKLIIDRLVDLNELEKLISDTFDQEIVLRRLSEVEKQEAETLMYMEANNGLNSTPPVRKPPKKKTQTRKGAPIETIEIMKRNASRTLLRLHNSLERSIVERDTLEERLRKVVGSSIDLRWAPAMAFYVYVSGKDIEKFETLETDMGNTTARVIISRKNTRNYHLNTWTILGSRIDAYKVSIRLEERKVFHSLRENVVEHMSSIRRNARVLDELDVGSSFATLARERKFVRPVMHNRLAHTVIAGRHPTVEFGLQDKGTSFVPNDCLLDEAERLWLVTGPNMGGKSTFLRQNALICILAQVGSFVPADFAELGIVDQIFSRVGSADNLYRDESTFMVEMLETANILRRATARSFVIMDEIGRGTTPVEGLAVAYGCLHHLYHINQSHTLFATHFHDLAEMIHDMPHAACYCTDLADDGRGGVYFVHKLKRGVNNRSHALHIAKLAGVPNAAIEVATGALAGLEMLHDHGNEVIRKKTAMSWNNGLLNRPELNTTGK